MYLIFPCMILQQYCFTLSLKLCIFMLQVPPTLRFVMDGEMPSYLLAKDLILQVSY